MNENYIVINGKKTELTEEQLKALGIKLENWENPFARVDDGDSYFYISKYSSVQSWEEDHDGVDDCLTDCCNYFNNEDFAKQVALHQLLYRKLLKFAYDNGCEDAEEWDGSNEHWTIRYGGNLNKFFAYSQERHRAPDVYFSSEEAARRAINEVVKPFMKVHPEFVW